MLKNDLINNKNGQTDKKINQSSFDFFNKQITDQKLQIIFNQNQKIKLQEEKIDVIENKLVYLLNILDAGSQQLTLNFLELQENKIKLDEMINYMEQFDEQQKKQIRQLTKITSLK